MELESGRNDRASLEATLAQLPFRELVRLFYGATRSRLDKEVLPDGKLRVYAAPVIAEAMFTDGDKSPEYRAIVSPSPEYDGWISDELTQNGTCGRCGTDCTGFAKESICPTCGAAVDMT